MDLVTELSTSSNIEIADEPFELSQDGELVIPEHLLSDWVEMLLLAAIILIGVPLNTLTLIRLLKSLHRSKGSVKTKPDVLAATAKVPTTHLSRRYVSGLLYTNYIFQIMSIGYSNGNAQQETTRIGFIWLKIHLTVIDLIVILLYCPSYIGWLYTYVWNGGEFLCMAVQYSWDFCFHLMSFGVVGIAVDRLRTVYRLMHINKDSRSPNKQLKFVRELIIFCYVGAAILSLPQWFVWTTVDMKTWSQCTTIWHKLRAMQYLHNQEFTDIYEAEQWYAIFHLITVFWLPFLVLFLAYLYIVVFLFCYSIRPYSRANEEPSNLLKHDATADSNENLQVSGTPTLLVNGNGSVRSSGIAHGAVPAWRLEMRSRMFRTTVYVIAAYLICWMPYNVLALAKFVSGELQVVISIHLELLRACVLLNTVLNPFIYGFRD